MLLWLGFALGYASVTHCSFVRKGDASKEYRSLEQMGVFKVPVYGNDEELLGCIRYDSGSEWDANFKIVRTVSVFLLSSLSILTILHTLSLLFLLQERRKRIIHWVGRVCIFPTLLFNSMLFIILGGNECKADDMQCRPGIGAMLAMLNELVIFVVALLYLLAPPPTHPVFVRYTSLPPTGGQSVFSVPEMVKAKNEMKKKANQSPKKTPQAPKDPTNNTGAIVLYNRNAGHPPTNTHRDGSSSSTLLLTTEDHTDLEAPPSPRRAKTYRAPSRTANV